MSAVEGGGGGVTYQESNVENNAILSNNMIVTELIFVSKHYICDPYGFIK